MRTNNWTKFKGICKKYLGIIVADKYLVEEGFNEEYMSQQKNFVNNEVNVID